MVWSSLSKQQRLAAFVKASEIEDWLVGVDGLTSAHVE